MKKLGILFFVLAGLSAMMSDAQEYHPGLPADPDSFYLGLTDTFDTVLYYEKLRVFEPVGAMINSHLDWRDHGCVTSTKNQGNCGSCWAFAVIACLESHILIEGSQTTYDLSEQYLVSCDNTNGGCNGGNIHVFNWMQTHPAVLEADFPYSASNEPCNAPYPTIDENFTNWYTLLPEDQVQFKAALSAGSVWVAFAVYRDFINYWNGTATFPNDVYYSNGVDLQGYHAVLLIGYDDSLEGGCWICKNSWGNTGPFGDGTFKIKYNSNCQFGYGAASIDFDLDPTDYFVLLIDRTGSMAAARTTGPGTRFLCAIQMAHDETQVIFNDYPDPKVAVMYFSSAGIFVELGFCDDQTMVDAAIDNVPSPSGNTPLGEAMCAAADILLNSPHAGEGYLYIYTDGDENDSSTGPVSLVCDACDVHSYFPWYYDCDPSDNNPPCTDMQLCLASQLIANSVTYARYFGQPITSGMDGDDDRPYEGTAEIESKTDIAEFKAAAQSDATYLQYLAEESGGQFYYLCDTCTYVPPSTEVGLVSFSASDRGGYIEIEWSTAVELDNAGFNIHRGTSIDGPYGRINESLIPAAGSSVEGASYTYIDFDISSGVSYYYRLEDIDIHGRSTMSAPVLASEYREPSMPVAFKLSQNYPNPFNPMTEIMFDLPVGCHVRLDIYDVLGKRVATLVDRYHEPGRTTVSWDGMNESGEPVSSGIYFCRLAAGSFVQIKKMSLLR